MCQFLIALQALTKETTLLFSKLQSQICSHTDVKRAALPTVQPQNIGIFFSLLDWVQYLLSVHTGLVVMDGFTPSDGGDWVT